MIYIATVHYKSDSWIDIQLKYLNRHIKEPFKVYAVLNGVGRRHFKKFFFAADYRNKVNNLGEYLDHRDKLNFLAMQIIKNARDEDTLVFLDGDAFPVARLDLFLNNKLKHYEIMAIKGFRGPHPSFYATKVKTWKKIKGRWGVSRKWLEKGKGRYNASIDSLESLFSSRVMNEDCKWHCLLRTNKKNLYQPLIGRYPFGIYEDLIYHHCGSFRENLVSPKPNFISRFFLHLPVLRVSNHLIRKLIGLLRRKRGINQSLLNNLEKRSTSFKKHIVSRELFKKINSDEHFYRELINE